MTFKQLASHLSEEECLDEVMRARWGGAPCPACESTVGFARGHKHRAFTCRACGHAMFPCQGTPFARDQIPLLHWFYTLHLAASGQRVGATRLQRALGARRLAAEQLAAGAAELRATGGGGRPGIDWLEVAAARVRAALDVKTAPGQDGSPRRSLAPDGRETVLQTLRSVFALPDFERRPLLGIALIGALAILGVGTGWLLVPGAPEEDAELSQATAILTLASDKNVIIITPEMAEQLYNVTDAEMAADSPLASTIRVAAAGTVPKPGTEMDTRPIAQPTVRLASSIGRALALGDLTSAKSKTQERPELAAYTSLARELEGGSGGNPNEVVVFGPMRVRRHLVEKIVRAARATHTDPVLLMAIADKESSFQTEVQAQTSSASGLFQFIEGTWLGVVREFGARYGLEKEARMVASGEFGTTGRSAILDLRRDAYLSAVMTAEVLKRESERIARRLGRVLTGGEIYLVHFLGPDGAERMLDQVARKPDAVAAELLPRPAAANRPIFYGSAGDGSQKSLSVSEVHGKFETMISLRLDRYRAVKTSAVPARPAR